MQRKSIQFSIFLMGFSAIIAQVLLVRELMVVFSGTELSIGIFIGNWLILAAFGSIFSAWTAQRFTSALSPFLMLQFFWIIFLPVTILAARIIPTFLGLLPGENTGLLTVLVVSFLILIPLGIINGALFVFACRLAKESGQFTVSPIARVYLLDAIGSIAGGVAVTYVCLQILDVLASVYILTLLTGTSALLLIYFHRQPVRFYAALHSVMIVLIVISGFWGGVEGLKQLSLKFAWPGYEIVSYRNSVYGNVSLMNREEQWHLLSNNVPIATFPVPDISAAEEIVHLPILFHPGPEQVFLIGGGLSGIINELIKYPDIHVDYSEPDPLLIETVEKYIPSLPKSERVNTYYTDGRYTLRNSSQLYDMIILDLPDPSTLVINRMYTFEFFRICANHLHNNGILVCRLSGSASYMHETLAKLHATILNTLDTVFEKVRVVPEMQTLFIACKDSNAIKQTIDQSIVRMNARQIQTMSINDATLRYLLDERRVRSYMADISAFKKTDINSDFRPLALYYDLLFWNERFSRNFVDFYGGFENFSVWHYSVFILGLFICMIVLRNFTAGPPLLPVKIIIFTSGFTGMGITVLMTLLFQAVYGYVYQWIGLIITAFMFGLAIGSWLASRQTAGSANVMLFKTDLYLFAFFALLSIAATNTDIIFTSPFGYVIMRPFILIMTCINGVLTGAQFPPAAEMHLAGQNQVARSGGILYAWDQTGAWIGGLLVTLLFVPITGIAGTCFLLMLLKGGSFVFFRIFNRQLPLSSLFSVRG